MGVTGLNFMFLSEQMRVRLVKARYVLTVAVALTMPAFGEDLVLDCEDPIDELKSYCSVLNFCVTLAEESQADCFQLAADMLPRTDGATQEATDAEQQAAMQELNEELIEFEREEERNTVSPQPIQQSVPAESTTESVEEEQPRRSWLPLNPLRLIGNRRGKENVAEVTISRDVPLAASNAYARLQDKEEFSAAVIHFQEVGYRGGIMVLSNGLAFRMEYSRAFDVELGDMVTAKRRSRFAKWTYVVSGGSGSTADARLFRCDLPDPSKDLRQVCQLAQSLIDDKGLK